MKISTLLLCLMATCLCCPGGQQEEETLGLPVYNGLTDVTTRIINGKAVEYVKATGKRLTGVIEVYFGGKLWTRKEYRNGIPHNVHAAYYPDGGKKYEFHFDNGVRIGQRRSWHEDGQPRSVSNYENGQLHGILQEWNANGNLEVDATYEYGMLVEVRLNKVNTRLNTKKNYNAGNIIKNG